MRNNTLHTGHDGELNLLKRELRISLLSPVRIQHAIIFVRREIVH